MPHHALSLETFPVNTTLRPAAETVEYVLVRLRAPTVPAGPRPRLQAVLVLDTSGSMGGDPLHQVIQLTQRLADILGDEDALGVVAFADGAQVVSPLRPLTAGNGARREIQRAAAALTAGGQTNMAGGLAQAGLLFPPRTAGERHLALLLSDGQPNVGASTPSALGEQARLLRGRDVATSALGFGPQHNDDVLIAIADAGGGRYAFVDEPKLAGAAFARALGAQRDVVAEELSLVLTPPEQVEILRVLGDPPTRVGAGGLRVGLQDAIAGDELNLIVELKVRAPRETGPWRPLKLLLTGRVAGTKDTWQVKGEVAVNLSHAGPFEQDPTALAAVAIAFADEMRTEARGKADRGDFRGAAEVLRKALAMIEGTPGYQPGTNNSLADARETLIDEIAAMERAPDQEKYQAFRRASRDYADFSTGGTKTRGGTSLLGSSHSAIEMVQRLLGSEPPVKAQLVQVVGAGTVWPLGLEMDIGRSSNSAITVLSAMVTRRHARVLWSEGRYWVVDLGLSNGTAVNGHLIDKAALTHGDVIRVGDIELRFELV